MSKFLLAAGEEVRGNQTEPSRAICLGNIDREFVELGFCAD